MIQIISAKVGDLDQFKFQQKQIDAAVNLETEIEFLIDQSWASRGPLPSLKTSVTIFDNDEVIAIVGSIEKNEGYCTVWAVVSTNINGNGFDLTAHVRVLIEELRKKCSLRRMDMYVLADCRRHLVWAKRLGFKSEGLLKKFGVHGEDYFMMARTW